MLPVAPPVPRDLQKLLDRLAQMHPEERRDEVLAFCDGETLPTEYCTCTWYDGCYYCKSEDGLWHKVGCSL
jgi:hypothetical protein